MWFQKKYLVHNGNMEKVLESLTNMIGKQSDGEKSNSKKSNETVLNNQLQSAILAGTDWVYSSRIS